MKENDNNFSDSSSDMPCKKHPSSSSVGICAYCLKDRLLKLVCSDCGEQRLSSCSCSDVSSYRNSCSAVEVGSVGRISFLIENERFDDHSEFRSHVKPKREVKERSEDVKMLKRSNSSCVEVKKSTGFWNIGNLFKKNRGKQSDEKTEIWVADCMGVSRSRSLCSFRGSSFKDPDQENSEFSFSSAKVSDVIEASEPRKSGFLRRVFLEAKNIRMSKEVRYGSESKQCGLKESDSSEMDDGSEFIDLNLDLPRSSETDHPFPVSKHIDSVEDLLFGHGGSCRITVNEKRVKKGGKGQKVWRWIISQQHQHSWRSSSKINKNHSFNV
ncbi:uncharacterized protein LOC141673788 [Apium graveolens]|uniref:uncharacterized protein LOC141673788 n=1 Tax=Apium graveolens TaxID=4045 RepID=UPI003D795E2B